MRSDQPRQPSARAALAFPVDRAVYVDDDRSAALLIRVWVEGGRDTFRCRLTAIDTTPAPGAGEERTLTVTSSPGEVMATVRDWLDGFLERVTDSIDSD